MSAVLSILIAAVVVASVVLFLVSVYDLYNKRNKRTNRQAQQETALAGLQSRLIKVERQLGELADILTYVRLTVALSVAFIRSGPTKLLLVKLRRGEFEGFWGFPAGYIDPTNKAQWENPKLKADYEIEQYLGRFRSEVEYVGSPTDDANYYFEIEYGGVTPVQVRVYEYILKDLETMTDPTLRIVDFGQLEGIEPLNPLVYDVLRQFTAQMFSADFETKMLEAKQKKPSSIISLEEATSLHKAKVTTGE